MLRAITARLRSAWPTGSPAYCRELRARGLDSLIVRAMEREGELDRAYCACRRVDWTIEIAVCGRVERALILEGLELILEGTADWPHDHRALAELVRRAREDAGAPLEIEALSPLLLALVDAAKAVRHALIDVQKAERWKNRLLIQRALDRYDVAHADTHRELADRFRLRATAEALRVALEGRSAHPYR